MNRLIAWFAGNHVAANLLMFGILIAGLMSIPAIKQTIFPDIELKMISITVVYPGAAPEEVEKSVTIRVEEKIQDAQARGEIPNALSARSLTRSIMTALFGFFVLEGEAPGARKKQAHQVLDLLIGETA